MEDEPLGNDLPYFQAVSSSPDEGELSDGGGVRKAGTSAKKSAGVADEEESRLRKKLLEKRNKVQPITRPRLTSADDEEMFVMQPGFQETKRNEAGSGRGKEHKEKSKERYSDGGTAQAQVNKEKERGGNREDSKSSKASRKPIEWKTSSEMSSSKPSSDTSSRLHPATLQQYKSSHGRRRSKSTEKRKRREDAQSREDNRRSEKASRRDADEQRPSVHHRDLSKSKRDVPSELKAPLPSIKHSKISFTVNPPPKASRPAINELEEIKSSSSSPADKSDFNGSPTLSPTLSANAKVEDEQMETGEDELVARPGLACIPPNELVAPTKSPIKANVEVKKYSKFESSPENEGSSDDDDDQMSFEDPAADADELNQEQLHSDSEIDDLSALEKKGFDELTEEEKAVLSPDTLKRMEDRFQKKLISQLPIYYPGISGCRNVAEFECLNRIEEGAYGVVYRALEKKTDEVVALKRLKMEKEREGFPITSLREINMLLKCGKHPNIVNVREIVVGSNMDKIYLVMEYVEHDMKSLMELMKSRSKKFTIPQVKTLVRQLLSGVEHMHEEYVIHRDLKTSNLLLSHNGILKIGDFGLAREFGSPIKPYTPIVVTLWYRSPELLLGIKEYSTAVDMWSVGCIFAEFLKLKPLFPGKGEIDQLNKIFMEIGTPNEQIWPGYNQLPGVRKFAFADSPFNQIRKQFASEIPTDAGFNLLNRLLAPCPNRRISASKALTSEWFQEDPLPAPPEMFPTWPAKSEHNKKPAVVPVSKAPAVKSNEPKPSLEKLKLLTELKVDLKHASKDGFALKFDAPKFK